MTVGTAQDFIAWLDARIEKPYSEVIDGGVGPDYFDCSGLTEVGLNEIGIPFTRTTYSQWSTDRARYQHFPAEGFFAYGEALPPLEIGDVLYMHVAGEPDPGHVGVFHGSGVYIDAPHTGAFVRIEGIPSTPSEHVYGIIRPPFATTPKPPNPTLRESNMIARDNGTNGYWVARSNGNTYAFDGAPYLGPLPKYTAQWGIGTAANPIVGIVSDNAGGFTLAADNGGAEPSIYHITSDGAYAK